MHKSDFRVELCHVNFYVQNQVYAQVGVVAFDNVLMLLRERMVHKKLLLKQREVVEVFTSGRDAIVSFPTSYSKNTNAFPEFRYC